MTDTHHQVNSDRRGRRSSPVVLVHGAWVGEWCWTPVQRELDAAGIDSYAVTLRGHGGRAHESGPHITLDDHVADVIDVLDRVERTGFTDVTLVGHSYGGRVITKAWERMPERIDRMIYVDAHAPLGTPAPPRDPGDDAMVPFGEFPLDPALRAEVPELADVESRLMPQSPATISGAFWVDLPDALPKTYVAATAETNPTFRAYAAAARADPYWTYVAVPASHWLIFSHPREVADAIAEPNG